MPSGPGGPVTGYKADVGAGWHPLLDELHAELAAADPDYQTIQVKEKFGTLRVYVYGLPATDAIIDHYEERSRSICENCGQPGRPRPGGWVKTFCDECEASRKERRKAR